MNIVKYPINSQQAFQSSNKIMIKTLQFLLNLDRSNLLDKISEIDIILKRKLIQKSQYKLSTLDKHIHMKKPNSKQKYNQLMTISEITFRVYNNVYIEIEQFLQDVQQLFDSNFNLFKDIKLCKQLFIKVSQSKYKQWAEQLSQTRYLFKNYLLDNNIIEKYKKLLLQDLQILFSSFLRYKCKIQDTSENSHDLTRSNDKFNYQISKKSQQFQQDYQSLSFMFNQSIKTYKPQNSCYSIIKRFPFPQNYPLIQDYEQQFQDMKTKSKFQPYIRKSLKRPFTQCSQDCSCIQKSGKFCQNHFKRVECQHHNCNNSQIKNKTQLICEHLDDEKNQNILQRIVKKHIQERYQVREFHSFGMDLYTIIILYSLMPYGRKNDLENQSQKRYIIQSLIPRQFGNTKRIFQSIFQLTSNMKYYHYQFQLQILYKKLIFIQKLHLQNLKSVLNNKITSFSRVRQLNCVYKGLGIFNSGQIIPQGKFIGKFLGQVVQSWRQQQRQNICLKVSKYGYKNEGPGHIKFYCISIISHLDEPLGVKYFSIDPQNKGNFCRSLNHSCNPNCRSQTIISQGQYILAIYAIKDILPDQQLTFDYMSITDNFQQYQNSQCLCSNLQCKGRFLSYQEQLGVNIDKVFLRKNYPIQKRLQNLIKGCIFKSSNNEKQLIQNKLKQFKLKADLNQNLSNIWFKQWMCDSFQMIIDQIRYNKNKSKERQKEENQQNKNHAEEEFIVKQKILMLTNKINKIKALLNSVNDYSNPIKKMRKQDILQMLRNTLSHNKAVQNKKQSHSSNQFPNKSSTSNKTLQFFSKQSFQLRRILILNAKQFYFQDKISQCQQYLQTAFRFLLIIPHIYPNYHSKPVRIWRQIESQIKQYIQYKGQNLYILQTLLCWGEQLKQLYYQKVQDKQISLSNTISLQFFQKNQLEDKNKRQLFHILIKQITNKIQENIFKMKKPIEINKMDKLTRQSFDQFIKIIAKWTKAESNFWKQYQKSEEIQVKVQSQVKIQNVVKKKQKVKKQQKVKKSNKKSKKK